MTVSLPARWAAAGVAGATAVVGVPLLAAGTSSPAAAQQSPAACSSATPTAQASASATPTATTSATPTATMTPGGGGPIPGPIGTIIASISPRPTSSATPTSTTSATPTSTTSATPTATTTPCPTATATASATPTATTSATPGSTTSPTPSAPASFQCVNPVGIALDREFLTPGVRARVTVTAPEGVDVELLAYSRPSTTFRQVRQATVPASGRVVFDVTPGTNTRLFARCVNQTRSASAQKVLNVRTALSLTVVRNGRRDYTFQGRLLPRRSGQLITLYRVESDGTRVLTKQIRSDATGTYRIRRVFTGSGRFGFLTRTGQTLTNAAGESGTRDQNSGRGTARPTAIF